MAPTRIVGTCCCSKYPVSVEILSVDFDNVYVYFGEFGEEDETIIFDLVSGGNQTVKIQSATHYSDGSVAAQEWRVPLTSYSSSSAFYYNASSKSLVFLLPVIETTIASKTYRTTTTNLTRSLYGQTQTFPASAYWTITFTDGDATQTGTEDGYPLYAPIPWEIGAEENYDHTKHTAAFEVVQPSDEDD